MKKSTLNYNSKNIQVFDIKTLLPVLTISCDTCTKYDDCKRGLLIHPHCELADRLNCSERIPVIGRVLSWEGIEFYIQKNSVSKREIQSIMKRFAKTNVR